MSNCTDLLTACDACRPRLVAAATLSLKQGAVPLTIGAMVQRQQMAEREHELRKQLPNRKQRRAMARREPRVIRKARKKVRQ